MNRKKMLGLLGILSIAALILAACAGAAGEQGPPGADGADGATGPAGPAGEQGPPGTMAELTCQECHNDGTVLYVAQQQWAKSNHGSGTSWAYAGARGSCSGCHSSESFTAMVEAGITAAEVETAPAVPSNANCRTCHEIHTSFTGEDWALVTTDPVTVYAFEDTTFDGGKGNLCVNCHQPRRQIAEAVDGNIEITSSHWGPHHGPQSAVLLGIGGAGDVEGSESGHSRMVEDTCVSCHVGEANDHDFGVTFAACEGCHEEAEDFTEEYQAEIEALTVELGELLEATGAIHDGHPVKGTYSEAVSNAAWNYIMIVLEDGSMGVHNPAYIEALLEASLESLK